MHANFKVVIHAFGGTSCMVFDTASLYSDTAEHRNPRHTSMCQPEVEPVRPEFKKF